MMFCSELTSIDLLGNSSSTSRRRRPLVEPRGGARLAAATPSLGGAGALRIGRAEGLAETAPVESARPRQRRLQGGEEEVERGPAGAAGGGGGGGAGERGLRSGSSVILAVAKAISLPGARASVKRDYATQGYCRNVKLSWLLCRLLIKRLSRDGRLLWLLCKLSNRRLSSQQKAIVADVQIT
ncbi:hypothetical protein NL676_029314 [Syzygium grande]|nr:hypothetical protein NL676_029314 [Syzygium grande]